MKRFIQLTLVSLVAVLGLAASPVFVAPTHAVNVFEKSCPGGGGGGGDSGEVTGDDAPGASGEGGSGGGGSSTICGAVTQDEAPDIIKNVITTILFILGMVAVIMIIIGGVRYTTSNGDAGSIKSAKDTILYAVIGLIVAIMAFAIVNFIIGRLS